MSCNSERISGADRDTESAAGTRGVLDGRSPARVQRDRIPGTGDLAVHADHSIPGHTAFTGQHGQADSLRTTRRGRQGYRAGGEAVAAERAAGFAERQVGPAGQTVLQRVDPDHIRFTGGDAWLAGAVGAWVRSGSHAADAGRRWAERPALRRASSKERPTAEIDFVFGAVVHWV